MTTETYRGVKLKVQKGREWGYLRWTIGGEVFGDWIGTDEAKALETMRSYVDEAAKQPEAYPPHWVPSRGALIS